MDIVERVVGSDVVLFWLDDHICQDGNCQDLRNEFETNTSHIFFFHDIEQCRGFLKYVKGKKVFCIIQGKHAQTIVPDILNETSVPPVIYVFCFNVTVLTAWGKCIDNIVQGGIFDHEKDLLGKMTTDLADYANLKVQQHRVKRDACQEWAQNLTQNAKRFKQEKNTLTFALNPLTDEERTSEQSS